MSVIQIPEGKTKKVLPGPELGTVVLEAKDDITAGDGAKHDVMQGKAEIANQTTCNVFSLLQACGLPLAYIGQRGPRSFLAKSCSMILYEVVVRREAHGSYLKRKPNLSKGQVFPQLVCEFFLKTTGKSWKGAPIPKDDPFIVWTKEGAADLYLPDVPLWVQEKPFLSLGADEVPCHDRRDDIAKMATIAKKAFLALEKAWHLLGRRLVDFKVEFGYDDKGNLLLADVIDNDSWRVLENGSYIDKQLYRDNADFNDVTRKYRHVRDLTKLFGVPRQRLILWRASDKDDLEPFEKALKHYGLEGAFEVGEITCSLHKEPVRAAHELNRALQEVPDSVILVYVGRSNGAGPTVSAQTTVPVITVPAGWEKLQEDVWSSLRTPSETPVATVLDPQNAVLAAAQILAAHNARAYMELRFRQEKRFVNFTVQ
jgi:phosphoribosylaminoimidazole carboxylase / phosphoribosylaminoimidazole-succinocarboxamide synthase